MAGPEPAAVEAAVRAWLETFVIGLNLCPFARPLLDNPSLHIAICESPGNSENQRAFLEELDHLQACTEAEVATTLLVFPRALEDFEAYLDFIDQCQRLLSAAGLEGVVQLASFHPDYLFAGEAPDDPSHYSNRSPYPMIHLLREDMLSRVLDDQADPDQIPERNIQTLRDLGLPELQRRWRALRN
jgi:hypothetical protein